MVIINCILVCQLQSRYVFHVMSSSNGNPNINFENLWYFAMTHCLLLNSVVSIIVSFLKDDQLCLSFQFLWLSQYIISFIPSLNYHLIILVTDPRVARDYFLWWSHYYYYYYFVIWTNLMKSNAFHNHIYHTIIFYYCRIVLFEIWNLNSTIVGWLIFYISKSIKHVLHATCKPSFP